MEFTNIGLASCCRRVKSLQILTPRLQLRGLSGSNWVVAPDLKGFGDSDKPFLARQYKDQVADFDFPGFFFFSPLSKKNTFLLSSFFVHFRQEGCDVVQVLVEELKEFVDVLQVSGSEDFEIEVNSFFRRRRRR